MRDTAGELRRAFDTSFAAAHERSEGRFVDLLGISVGGDPHAIRIDTIASVCADRPITPLPGRAPALLGIAGIRGSIVPVFDLGALLGYPPVKNPRWFALAKRSGSSIALAFEAFVGQLRVAPDAFTASSASHVVVEAKGRVWPVIEIGSVIDAIDRQGET